MASSVFLPLDAVVMISKSAQAVSGTATTAEEIYATIPLSPGVLATGVLGVDASYMFTGSTNAKTVRCRIGPAGAGLSGTEILNGSLTGASQIATRYLTGVQAITPTAQIAMNALVTGSGIGAATTTAPAALTLDSSVPLEIVLSGQKASSGETLTLLRWLVTLTQ